MPRHHFADWEAELIALLYPHYPTAWLAQAMGRSEAAIYAKAFKMGLTKTAAFRNGPLSGQIRKGGTCGAGNRFKPGHTTWNKGMKGLDIGGKETRFKPGHLPQTWRPIGHTRTTKDGYLQRKVQDTRETRRDYVGIHHLVWRMHGHTIPDGHALVFRDGDKRNFDINNLEMVSRAELMRRNTVHRLPPDVRQVMFLTGWLNRKINKLEKHHGK